MSQILDLNSHQPIKGERYFIDTNVWFWATYVASKSIVLPQQPDQYQLNDYPKFLQRALDDGASLCHCPLTLAELANVIEKTELDIYRQRIGNNYYEKKEFRRIESERKAVLNEIEVAWSSINAMSKCIDIKLDLKFVELGRNILGEGTVDPFDAFFIQIMRDHYIDYVVTDDRDFTTIQKQILITANPKAIKKPC
ncbi:MAG: PIN domain-containing protein [Methylomicrobium sp.]|jgi:predicted nucleic acid-binding protein